MNLGKLGLCTAGAVASIALILAACTSSTTTTGSDGGSSSGTSGSSGTGDSATGCFPAAGMYTVTYTADTANSATCDSAMSLDGTETVDIQADLAPDAGEAVTGCAGAFTAEASGCTETATCVTMGDGGVMETTTIVTTVTMNDATTTTGTLTKVTTSGASQTCKYTFTGTKK
jgi:hypothetical protein